MASTPAVKPITYLKSSTAEAVKRVSESGAPMIITQNGEAKAVLVDYASYHQWQETVALLKLLSLAEADVRAGRVFTHREAMKSFDAGRRSARK
jgi:prevent-host-death family protein